MREGSLEAPERHPIPARPNPRASGGRVPLYLLAVVTASDRARRFLNYTKER